MIWAVVAVGAAFGIIIGARMAANSNIIPQINAYTRRGAGVGRTGHAAGNITCGRAVYCAVAIRGAFAGGVTIYTKHFALKNLSRTGGAFGTNTRVKTGIIQFKRMHGQTLRVGVTDEARSAATGVGIVAELNTDIFAILANRRIVTITRALARCSRGIVVVRIALPFITNMLTVGTVVDISTRTILCQTVGIIAAACDSKRKKKPQCKSGKYKIVGFVS